MIDLGYTHKQSTWFSANYKDPKLTALNGMLTSYANRETDYWIKTDFNGNLHFVLEVVVMKIGNGNAEAQ